MAKKRNRKNIAASTTEHGVTGAEFCYSISGGSTPKYDPLPLLYGSNKYKWFTEMILNDPFIGANFKLTTVLGSKSKYKIKEASDSAKDKKIRDLVSSCIFDDMEESFSDFVKFVISSVFAYGFGLTEIVYKKRKDGYFGIKKLAKRRSPTIDSWDLDPNYNIKGVWQLDPNTFKKIKLDYNKLLHFKMDSIDGSPEGMALLRNCFTSYHTKKTISIDETIRVHKDSRGINKFSVPMNWLDKNNTKAQAFITSIRKGLANISNSQDSYILIPSDPGFEYTTEPITGQITQDTDRIIERCNRDIAISLLSDFVLLGHNNAASGNIAQTKVKIYSSFIGSLLDIIKNEINKKLIPQICNVNGFYPDKYPELTHTNLQELELLTSALILQSKILTMNVDRQNAIGEMYFGEDFPKVTQEDLNKANKDNKVVGNNTSNKGTNNG